MLSKVMPEEEKKRKEKKRKRKLVFRSERGKRVDKGQGQGGDQYTSTSLSSYFLVELDFDS